MTSASCALSLLGLTMWLLGQIASPAAAQTSPQPAPVDLHRVGGGEGQAALPDDAPAMPARPHRLESILGREVRTRVEEDVGRIVDLLADRHGRVQAAVIEFGGFLGIGTRKIAVEWSTLSFAADAKQPAVIVNLSRDQLRAAPEYKPNEPWVVRRASD